jgi:aspartyl-tRNA(Asn)/glutamyl-tRNA(Gln) amidotransferase subunit C
MTEPSGAPPSTTIAEDEVRRLADLARLDLEPAELARLTREIGAILAYVRQLEEVDVAGVEPTSHVVLDELPLRADLPQPSLGRDQALAAAPRAVAEGFAVPTFVDEG